MDDLISRQAAIDAIDRLDIPEDMCVFEILSHIGVAIATLPSAQSAHKDGKWILPNNSIAASLNEWICSECNYLINGKHNYYPNCGAKMRLEEEEENE